MSLFDHVDGVRGASNGAPIVVIRLAAPPTKKGKQGAPVGKDDPRSRIVQPKRGGSPFVIHYTGARTRDYEDLLRAAAIDAMRGKEILDGPLEVLIFAYFPIPDSWP